MNPFDGSRVRLLYRIYGSGFLQLQILQFIGGAQNTASFLESTEQGTAERALYNPPVWQPLPALNGCCQSLWTRPKARRGEDDAYLQEIDQVRKLAGALAHPVADAEAQGCAL